MIRLHYIILFVIISGFCGCVKTAPEKIDRFSLVNRHNILLNKPDIESVLSVGNGEIAYNVGITGLQSFPGYYSAYPLTIQSQWGWHSFPNNHGYTLVDVSKEMIIRGEKRMYPSIRYSLQNPSAGKDNPAYNYLRQNPHRINLGCIGFDYEMEDGKEMKISDIINPTQKLNLWNGEIISDFRLEEKSVHVKTL